MNGIKSNLKAVGITFAKESKSNGAYITLKNENLSPLPSLHVDSAQIMGFKHGDAPGPSNIAPTQYPHKTHRKW